MLRLRWRLAMALMIMGCAAAWAQAPRNARFTSGLVLSKGMEWIGTYASSGAHVGQKKPSSVSTSKCRLRITEIGETDRHGTAINGEFLLAESEKGDRSELLTMNIGLLSI